MSCVVVFVIVLIVQLNMQSLSLSRTAEFISPFDELNDNIESTFSVDEPANEPILI